MTTWVPASCTLPTTEQPLRVAQFDALFAERLAASSRPDRLRVEMVLTGGPDVEDRARDLVARESGCCSFFTFTVTPGPEQIRLDVEVDGAHEAVLDALHERATAAAGPQPRGDRGLGLGARHRRLNARQQQGRWHVTTVVTCHRGYLGRADRYGQAVRPGSA
ncbi:hypothetical protein [Streptomyces sp. NPDC001530]|uniref:hypothetical protein n=1 Tax=Streptomyces sp. NPDC001530 TaxID=3364582 RepID=UPI0036BA5AFB